MATRQARLEMPQPPEEERVKTSRRTGVKRREKVRTAREPRIGLLTVGETAKILGVSPSTLRLWESVGLISPARSNGRYRLYGPELLQVLKRIKYLRDVKLLNLPGIRQELGKSASVAPRTSEAHGPTDLGRKLRQLRKRRGLSVVEASKLANISPGFLSAIELSRANPSVSTLQRLSAAYGVTVLEFYDLPNRSKRLVRPKDRRAINTESGVRMELCSMGAKHLESMIFRVAPGAGSGGAYSHEGEEFIYMMAGSLELWLDELECYTLREGDSFWFESNQGHRWFNPSTDEAVLIWINTPPTF